MYIVYACMYSRIIYILCSNNILSWYGYGYISWITYLYIYHLSHPIRFCIICIYSISQFYLYMYMYILSHHPMFLYHMYILSFIVCMYTCVYLISSSYVFFYPIYILSPNYMHIHIYTYIYIYIKLYAYTYIYIYIKVIFMKLKILISLQHPHVNVMMNPLHSIQISNYIIHYLHHINTSCNFNTMCIDPSHSHEITFHLCTHDMMKDMMYPSMIGMKICI